MGVRGDFETVNRFKAKLRELPTTMAHDVAQRAAPDLTSRTQEAFSSGRTVYGETRPEGVDGNALTLKKSGATARDLRFVAIGTIVRCVLGPRWARYLIGKYAILPMGALPAAWSARLRELVAQHKVEP